MKIQFEVLQQQEIEKVHGASLRVLLKTGMRFESEQLLRGLEKAGAHVDNSSQTVRFPEKLVEKTIENSQRLIKDGKKLHLLNGVTSENTGGEKIAAKISGGCEYYMDWETQDLREAAARELLRYIRLGERLPDVAFVGNPVVLKRDFEGNLIDERMRRIKTAALIAKNTRKVGSMEVWSEKEIDLLVEIGMIVRDGKKNYFDQPCLVTAKETISPLFLDEDAGNILLALAKRDLPCTIIPMPITGMSTPVTMLGNTIVGNAEILGVMTAIQSVVPNALVGGGIITGIMDMQSSVASFSAPEAILQDIAVAEVHGKLYGLNFLIGTGYTDAKYPNSQTLSEKTMKYLLTYLSGRYSYPLGLINSGSVFSAEQALVDLEICRDIHAHFRPVDGFTAIDELVGLVDSIGIRGHFLESDHTLDHFRENFLPQIYDRSGFATIGDSKAKDIYLKAHERMDRLLADGDYWEIEKEKAGAIDEVVTKAEKTLT